MNKRTHMNIRVRTIGSMLAFWVAPAALYAQFDFKVDGRPVQVHSFAQQGFLYSNNNNFLTVPTSDGSFKMTDGGMNASASITDSFRVGAQVYARNIGDLGGYHVQLDWAYGDYKFKDWFGIRAGKVKTALGLFNDTQDAEFLYTWALLPQSMYPLDLRSNSIAHTGADIYGQVSLRKAGSLSYTGYYGTRVKDTRGGYYFTTLDGGFVPNHYSGKTGGIDVHWNTPIQGLMLGSSFSNQTLDFRAKFPAYGNAPLSISAEPQHLTAFYGDYARGRWHLSGEYRKNRSDLKIILLGPPTSSDFGDKSMFLAAAFRVNKHLELGTYNSRYYINKARDPRPAADHIFDQTVTARIDITKWWNVKVEGHFMNGFGDTYSAHGFYTRDNKALKPDTNMFIIRTGYNL